MLEGWPDIKLAAGTRVQVGRLRSCDVLLDHASISRRHAELELGSDGVVHVHDGDSRFGTFVNGARVAKALLHPGGSIRFGASPLYILDDNALRPQDTEAISLSLHGLGVRRGDNQLLRDVTAEIPAGALVGILGPSGAGKSLTLSCLSGTILPDEGTILVDGTMDLNGFRDAFRARCGIVGQEDAVFLDHTVDENLRDAAVIRLPSHSPVARQKAIEEAMQSLDLVEQSTKRVSVLSGGQRKRVSIALELIRRPGLLLLDEPTSGLDPAMQARLMETLRQLARRAVTIVCTTHTLETLHYFDRVLVLGLYGRVGTVAYDGSPQTLLAAFGVSNYPDLFDKLLSIDEPTALREPISIDSPVEELSATTAHRPGVRRVAIPQADQSESMAVAFRRTIFGLARDPLALLLALGQPPLLAALIAFSQSGRNVDNELTVLSLFIAVCSLWLGLTLTIRELVRERHLYARDRLAGMPPLAYLAGKAGAAAAVTLVQSGLFSLSLVILVPLFLGNVTLVPRFAEIPGPLLLLACWLMALAGAVQGLIVSVLANSERTAVAAIPLILLPQIVFSRPVFGDANLALDEPSPYRPLGLVIQNGDRKGAKLAPNGGLSEAFIEEGMDVGDIVTTAISGVLPTRPGTATLQLLSRGDHRAAAVVDLLHLTILLTASVLLLQWLFLRQELRWLSEER